MRNRLEQLIVGTTICGVAISCGAGERSSSHSGELMDAVEAPVATRLNRTVDSLELADILIRAMPSGEFIVADRRSKELYRLGNDGGMISRVAGAGNGPGEIPGRFGLSVGANEVVVAGVPPDPRGVNRYDAGGKFIETLQLRHPETKSSINATEVLAPGVFLIEIGRGFTIMENEPKVGDWLFDSTTTGVLDVSNPKSHKLLWARPRQRGVAVFHESGRPGVKFPSTSPYPFGSRELVAAAGDHVWIFETRTRRLFRLTAAGDTMISTTLPETPPSDLESRLVGWRDRQLVDAGTARDSARIRMISNVDLLPAEPAVADQAIGAADGRLWIRLLLASTAANNTYVVIDTSGRVAGRVELPESFELQHATDRMLLGTMTRPTGEVVVMVYEVSR